MRRLLVIGILLSILTLTLSTVYGCIYMITTRHFKICLKYCELNYTKCIQDMRYLAKTLENVYNFYIEKLHLKILPPCYDDRYIVEYSAYKGLKAYEKGAFTYINGRCVLYFYFAEIDTFTIAHELAHAVNHYYLNPPSWIDESLANALANYYLNHDWSSIFTIYPPGRLKILNDILSNKWLPGVPYDYWPFFYYLITHYNITKLYEKRLLTNMRFLEQNWLPFLKNFLLFYPYARKVATYEITITHRNMITQIIVSPWFNPTIIVLNSTKPIYVKLRTSCKNVEEYPSSIVYISPKAPAVVLVYTQKKHFTICDLNIQALYTTGGNAYIDINGTYIELSYLCNRKNIKNIIGYTKVITRIKTIRTSNEKIYYITTFTYKPRTAKIRIPCIEKRNKKAEKIRMYLERIILKIINYIVLLLLTT